MAGFVDDGEEPLSAEKRTSILTGISNSIGAICDTALKLHEKKRG
jgi:hypothetical protein